MSIYRFIKNYRYKAISFIVVTILLLILCFTVNIYIKELNVEVRNAQKILRSDLEQEYKEVRDAQKVLRSDLEQEYKNFENNINKLVANTESLNHFTNHLLGRIDSLERKNRLLESRNSDNNQEIKDYKKKKCSSMVSDGSDLVEISEGYHCLAQIETEQKDASSIYRAIRYESLALEGMYRKEYHEALLSMVTGRDFKIDSSEFEEYILLNKLSESKDINIASRALYRMSLMHSIGKFSSDNKYNYNLLEAHNLKKKAMSLVNFSNRRTTDVLFTIDNNPTYIRYAKTAIASILLNADLNTDYNLYFVTDEESPLSENNKLILSSLQDLGEYKVHFIHAPSDLFYKDKKSIFGHEMRNQIQRFTVEDVLVNLDSIVYLDVDLIVLRDLYDLQNMNFEGNIFAASTEDIIVNRKDSCDFEYKYVNIGVVVHNLSLMREIKNSSYLTNKYSNYLEGNHHTPYKALKSDKCFLMPNQDMFNKIYQGKIKFISRRWNYIPVFDYSVKVMPFIIHFAGEKPSEKGTLPSNSLYMKYKELADNVSRVGITRLERDVDL
ncbi:MAG: hypothetical protein N4A31_06025 [Rickettsiales bacterium]|jgi:lipopolysaccharide biosynthesis glycosyltransferase|nr:hypothetical protein [Rickettsiales bacterium]